MPDNLEQLEKVWPQPRPKNLSPQAFTRMYFWGAVVMAAFVNIEAGLHVHRWISSHRADPLRFAPAFTILFAVQWPWLFALAAHRQIKKRVLSTGGNSEMMQLIRHQGIYLIFWMYLAINMIFGSLDLMRR